MVFALLQIDAFSQKKHKDSPDLVYDSLDGIRANSLNGEFTDMAAVLSPNQTPMNSQGFMTLYAEAQVQILLAITLIMIFILS